MKSIKRVAAVALAATMAFTALPATKVHAINYREKDGWYVYNSGGTINMEDVANLEYKNYFSHCAEAEYVRYSGSIVKLRGSNVYLYDIPKGKYTSYAFTATVLRHDLFRPFNRSETTISRSYFKFTIDSTDTTFYAKGCIGWY